jgi:hypothetical protein
MMLSQAIVTLGFILLNSNLSYADNAALIVKKFPFNQTLNMSVIYDVTHSKPEELIKKIQNYNVDIVVVKSNNSTKMKNPIFHNLKNASDELIAKAEFESTYDGRLVFKTDACCDLKKDTILIKDNAESYTLIHEFMHSQLIKNGAMNENIEKDFLSAKNRLSFYHKKLLLGPEKLLSTLWRKDILERQHDYSQLLFERLQMGQSQEAIIEKILSDYIDQKNPYYVKQRAANGYKYGQLMLDNAISIYNEIYEQIEWTRNTTTALRDSIESGHIQLDSTNTNESLTKEETIQFEKKSNEMLQFIKGTEKEILSLLDLYKPTCDFLINLYGNVDNMKCKN